MGWTRLRGAQVTLRVAEKTDVPELARIRSTPEVRARWRGGDDLAAEVLEAIEDDGVASLVVELDGRVVGAIQWAAEEDPEYRHASIDIYLDPAVHGRGVGEDAVRTLATHLVDDEGLPPAGDRPRGGQRGSDPVLQQGGFQAGGCHAAVRTRRDRLARRPTDGPAGRRAHPRPTLTARPIRTPRRA